MIPNPTKVSNDSGGSHGKQAISQQPAKSSLIQNEEHLLFTLQQSRVWVDNHYCGTQEHSTVQMVYVRIASLHEKRLGTQSDGLLIQVVLTCGIFNISTLDKQEVWSTS